VAYMFSQPATGWERFYPPLLKRDLRRLSSALIIPPAPL
jgi:hypothetical protein